MFCGKCGTKNEDDAKFCANCGAPLQTLAEENIDLSSKIETQEPVSLEQTTVITNTVKPKKKKSFIIFIVIALVAVAIGAGSWFFLSKPKNVSLFENKDISKYVEVTGVNGKGTAAVDTEAMKDDIKKKLSSTVSLDTKNGSTDDQMIYNELINSIDINCENLKNLSNGDKVKVEVSLNAQQAKVLKIEVTDTEGIYKVADLKEVKILDLFKDVSVEWQENQSVWYSSSVTYSPVVKNNSKDEMLKNFDYYANDDGNGMVTVYCNISEEKLNSLGYTVDTSDDSVKYDGSSYSKTYIVGASPEKEANTPIGKITCNVDKLNIRTDHSKSSEKTYSRLYTGDVREVYEIYEGSKYTWYRIGANQWVADSGGWLTYEKY